MQGTSGICGVVGKGLTGVAGLVCCDELAGSEMECGDNGGLAAMGGCSLAVGTAEGEF